MGKRSPEPYDVALGARICAARRAAGMTQAELGRALDLTFQQIQKYEKGVNRVAVSTLIPMARALGVTVEHLMPRTFDDGAVRPDPLVGMGASIGGVTLARLYARMTPDAQRSLLEVARAITEGQAAQQGAAA